MVRQPSGEVSRLFLYREATEATDEVFPPLLDREATVVGVPTDEVLPLFLSREATEVVSSPTNEVFPPLLFAEANVSG